MRADAGTQIERDRVAGGRARRASQARPRAARAAAAAGGTVDAYVVSIALDSDPVFGREARVAGDVLQRRYGAQGRTIVLAGSDGSAPERAAARHAGDARHRARPHRRADGQA